jgi:hypothetical protein
MCPMQIPPPATAAYWRLKDAAARDALQLRREALDRAWRAAARGLQRVGSLWHGPLNWRNVRGSIG